MSRLFHLQLRRILIIPEEEGDVVTMSRLFHPQPRRILVLPEEEGGVVTMSRLFHPQAGKMEIPSIIPPIPHLANHLGENDSNLILNLLADNICFFPKSNIIFNIFG
jgi:hypothetical protein